MLFIHCLKYFCIFPPLIPIFYAEIHVQKKKKKKKKLISVKIARKLNLNLTLIQVHSV